MERCKDHEAGECSELRIVEECRLAKLRTAMDDAMRGRIEPFEKVAAVD